MDIANVLALLGGIGLFLYGMGMLGGALERVAGAKLEKMLESGYVLGGEQSGHVILLEHSTTGDGQLTALKLLEILSESNMKASELRNFVKKYPHLFNDDKLPYKDLLHYIGYLAPACRDAFLLQCAGFFMKEIMDIQYREGFLKNMKISTVHSRTIVARRKLEDILLREGLLGGCD